MYIPIQLQDKPLQAQREIFPPPTKKIPKVKDIGDKIFISKTLVKAHLHYIKHIHLYNSAIFFQNDNHNVQQPNNIP